MSLYSLAPYFVVLAAIYALFSLPVFRFLDPPPANKPNRLMQLDGLRGWAALSIVIFHALITHGLLVSDEWKSPQAPFYNELGSVTVACFFMITGFLFWEKLVVAAGKIDWRKLYINRVFRIGPMYLVLVAIMVLIVFWQCDFTRREPWSLIIQDIAWWALPLGAIDPGNVNYFGHTSLISAGVTWTLKYEWWFYFSLLVLALFSGKRWHLWFALAGLAASLAVYQITDDKEAKYVATFFCGIACASLVHKKILLRLPSLFTSALALGCMMAALMLWYMHNAVPLIFLGVFFYILCTGNTLFGFLVLPAAQRLGHISYSVYLLQGPMLVMLFWPKSGHAFALASNANYWVMILIDLLLLSLISAATYRFIERPGIALGKKLGG